MIETFLRGTIALMLFGNRNRSGHNGIKNIFLSVIAIGLIGMGSFLLWISSFNIPDLKTFESRKISQSTKIYDHTGEILLYDVHENIKRTVIPFADISQNVKNASIAIEDAEFYKHHGIKPKSIARAILVNLGAFKFSQGGSTITQQVVKNSILTSEKKVSRKIKEWVLALKLEKVLTKDQILEMYLNEAPYGGSIYGVEEASQAYFDKSAHDITLVESAYIAALPQAPTFYSPYGKNKSQLDVRKNLVLDKMLENGYITEKEHDAAQKEKVLFQPQATFGIRAPHFVMYVVDYLKEKYGESAIEDGGMRVITTLDYGLQEKGEEIAKRYGEQNSKTFKAENVSMVAIDPKSGDILAMIGSRNYFDDKIDGNFNVALGHRQPGSSFKPFIYATAFKKGFTPDTVVFDVQTEFSSECMPDGTPRTGVKPDVCYMPVNYDNIYRGPISFRNALAQSINIPAIKVFYLAGLNDSLQTAKDFGISTLTNINQYGLTLVLGGGEVTLLDMTSAYGVFANDGVRTKHTAILKISKEDGTILESSTPKPTRVIEANVARQISDVLSDNTARTPAFGANSPLYFPGRSVAAKTGTTNDYRDAWIVGYAPDISIGAWAGNNDNSPMEKKVAGFIVAPMWHEFMALALKNIPERSFPPPAALDTVTLKPALQGIWQGGFAYTIDSITGKLATDYTPSETRKSKVVQNVHSILHWIDRSNILGPAPENPERDYQYESWEYGVRKWAAEHGYTDESSDIIPKETDTIHGPSNTPQMSVVGISDAVVYERNAPITLTISNTSSNASSTELVRADFYINGTLVGSVTRPPIVFSFTPSDIESLIETNTLRIVGYDTVFNKSEVTTSFTVN